MKKANCWPLRLICAVLFLGLGAAAWDAARAAEVAPPTKLVAPGKLTYGTAATFPPFEYREGDKLTGFDIEMIGVLAQYMGLTPDPLDMSFDGLIPALKGGRIDIINSAMYIKPEREQQVDFIPYMVIGEAIIVPNGNPKKVAKVPDDLSGLTVAVTRGAIGERYMVDFNKQLEAKNMKPMEILTFPTNQDAMLAVASGRADAFDTSIPGGAFLQKQRPGEFEVAVTFDLGTKIGIAVRKGEEDTARAIKAAVERFVKDGHYEKLLAKYNLPPAVNYFKQ